MLNCIKPIREFLVQEYKGFVDATKLYSSCDFGYRLLIPDSKNELGRISYTRLFWVEVDTLSAKISTNELKHIAESLIPPAKEETPYNISQNIYCFVIDKMIGRFKSRKVNNDIYLFFNRKKLGSNQIKFRVYKIIGRLLIKRAEKIIESTYNKIRNEPYGWLQRLVQFFLELGHKLVKIASKNIIPLKQLLLYNNNIRYNSSSKNYTRTILNHHVESNGCSSSNYSSSNKSPPGTAIVNIKAQVINVIKKVFGEDKARDVALILSI